MAIAVIMPKAGMSMETGTVIKWLKKIGDAVATGDPLVEIETDKVAMEVEAETSGFLLSILHDTGDVVPVTQTIAWLGTAEELKAGFKGEAAAQAGAPSASNFMPTTSSVPASSLAPAPNAAAAGGKVPMTPAARARAKELGIDPATLSPSGPQGEVRLRDVEAAGTRPNASPLARKVADIRNVDIAGLAGTGPGGRILRKDVEGAAKAVNAAAAALATEGSAASYPALAGLEFERVPLSRTRKVIADRLSKSMFTAPHYYLKSAIPADNLAKAREITAGKGGKKISVNAFLMKMAAEALKKYPMVNASWQGDAIAVFKSIDIGLAVAQPDGLITPIVRDCGGKGILQIEEELAGLIERAKTGKLLPDEYTNATFSISNLGSFGIDEFTAVINPPGSAILAVGSMKREPVVEADGIIAARTLLRVTLSCDHRVIDGAVGAGFLKLFGSIVENPVRALM
jgi:pyruvate dehydrogenase E2 component (dihydrolipoamide acetyltransferase)